jgi:WD40 repeat protein
MSLARAHLSLVLCSTAIFCYSALGEVPLASGEATLQTPNQGQRDSYGDLLPTGAVFRLGTVRLRHRGEVWSTLVSTDGRTVIAGGPLSGEPDEADAIRFWDIATGKLVRSLDGQPYGSGCLALSPDGKLLASESGATLIWLWDLSTGKPIHKLEAGAKEQGNIISVAFSPDGKTLAASGASSPIQLWDISTGTLRRRFGDGNGSWSLAYSPDGKNLAAAG